LTDYWLNKLFFDLQQPGNAAAFKRDRPTFLKDYPMNATLRDALIADDLASIAPHANAYLLRFYYAILGVNDADFIKRLNALPDKGAPHNG
jgi:Aromatic-ring-opening dioxygenase LigAB, LigA subunit